MDPAVEDAFCQRMRALDAKWFGNETEAEKQTPLRVTNGKRDGQTEVCFGCPELGGAWVSKVEEFDGASRCWWEDLER